MSAADNLQSEQLRLFPVKHNADVSGSTVETSGIPKPVADPTSWAYGGVWHASEKPRMPQQRSAPGPEHDGEDPRTGRLWSAGNPHPLGVHAGSSGAAIDRQRGSGRGFRNFLHPMAIRGDSAVAWEEDSIHHDDGGDLFPDQEVWEDSAANGGDPASTRAVRNGENVWYHNDSEDVGSTSVRAPRQNLQTWAESVVENPHTFSYGERQAVRDGYDLVYLTKDHAKMYSQQFGDTTFAKKRPGVNPSKIEVDHASYRGYGVHTEGPDRVERLHPRLVRSHDLQVPPLPPDQLRLF